MKNSRVDLPSRSRLQLISARMVEDSVVPLVPALQAGPHIIARGPRLQPHKCIGEVVIREIILRREVICFRLSFLSHARRELIGLMQMVRNRTKVVEELTK